MQQPNFIITDTQGANVVGAYGHPELDVPPVMSQSLVPFLQGDEDPERTW